MPKWPIDFNSKKYDVVTRDSGFLEVSRHASCFEEETHRLGPIIREVEKCVRSGLPTDAPTPRSGVRNLPRASCIRLQSRTTGTLPDRARAGPSLDQPHAVGNF